MKWSDLVAHCEGAARARIAPRFAWPLQAEMDDGEQHPSGLLGAREWRAIAGPAGADLKRRSWRKWVEPSLTPTIATSIGSTCTTADASGLLYRWHRTMTRRRGGSRRKRGRAVSRGARRRIPRRRYACGAQAFSPGVYGTHGS